VKYLPAVAVGPAAKGKADKQPAERVLSLQRSQGVCSGNPNNDVDC